MKMKQISDTTVKITIKLEDLEERGMEMADFLVPQEKTEEFFYAILDELEMPDSFLESGMLSFRVTPKPDRLDIFVTKSNIDKNFDFENMPELPDMEELAQMTPDDFIKTLEKTILEKSQEDTEAVSHLAQVEQAEEDLAEAEEEEPGEDYIYYILKFSSLAGAVHFARTVDYPVDTSELYKLDGNYYLTILVNVEGQPQLYPAWLLASMREHAEDSHVTRPILQEHGYLLLVGDALPHLQRIVL